MAYIQIPAFTKKGSFTNDTEFVIVVDGVEYLITYKTLSDTFGNTPELLQEINAEIEALRNIVDAFPSENPAAPIALKISDTPTIDGIYKPTETGVYPNAGGLEYDPTEGITYFIRTDGVWTKDVTPINFIPTGVVEEGNTQAVSGGEVYNKFKKVGLKTLEKDVNIISELVGSDKDNTDLWGVGYFWQDGLVRNDSANIWRFTKNYYPIGLGLFNVHLTISNNACLIYYNNKKEVIGFYKNTTSPTMYTYTIDNTLADATYFRFCHNFTAEPSSNLLNFAPDADVDYISDSVFMFQGQKTDNDGYIDSLNLDKKEIGDSMIPSDLATSDYDKYLETGFISNSGETTPATWNATNGIGWSNNRKFPFYLPKGARYKVESTMSGAAQCAILNEELSIINLLNVSSPDVTVVSGIAQFEIDLMDSNEDRYLILSMRDYNPVTHPTTHITELNKTKVTALTNVFYQEINNVVGKVEFKEIKHSLQDSVNLPKGLEMFDFSGNSITEVGLPNTIYKLPIPTNNKELRIKFDVRFDEDINILGSESAKTFSILKWYNRSFRTQIAPKNTIVATDSWGSGYANTATQCIRSNSQLALHFSGGTFTPITFAPSKMNTFGEFLFGIQYNEDVETNVSNRDVCLSITNTLFRIYKKTTNTTLYSKVITEETLVSEIFNELEDLSFLNTFIKGTFNIKATELIKISEINLSSISRWVDGSEYWDSGICWIPKAISGRWHTVEMVFANGQLYYVFDGETYPITTTIDFVSPDTIMYFGGELGVANNLNNTIRNIHINMNYLGDAEIVNYSLNYPLVTPKVYTPKLVSDYNPLVYIFVGHNVQYTTEDNVTYIDGTECSSERLEILFKHLSEKGYVSVTPTDIMEWKKGLKMLPKRCFVPIFDDYRFEIYANPNIKSIFDRWNVKGSLALITSRVYNGYANQPNWNGYEFDQYNFFQKMNLDGWHVHSHTRDHDGATGYLRFRKTSEMYNELNLDTASAIKANAKTDVLTYPQGQTRATAMYSLMNSTFQIALLTANGNNLPAMGNNDYYMYRVELGHRNPLQNLLDSIV